MKKPELLAPAGNWDALRAAVQGGADAVYLGGKNYNARQGADNFDEQEIVEAMDYAHVRGVKVHFTMNTILADSELKDALRYLRIVYNAGADALIVQDPGLIKLAKLIFPDLALHASTQMTVHNIPGAQLLKNAGLSRIVMAREMDLASIANLRRETDIEVETFIHGALCVCYSGQCLMSSMIGGRSGNRGRCAQPCRMEYHLENGQKTQMAYEPGDHPGNYLLSPRDLNLSASLPDLIKAGIDSFKIEGRMRRPEYVAVVTNIYRTLIDRAVSEEEYYVTPEESSQLAQIFNRLFTQGYYYSIPGRDLMSYLRPNNRGVKLGRVKKYHQDSGKVVIELEAPLNVGDGIEVWVSKGGRVGGEATVSGAAGDMVTMNLSGYIHPGDRVFKTNDHLLTHKAKRTYSPGGETKRIPLDFKVTAAIGEPLVLEGQDNEWVSARANTDEVGQKAINLPLTKEFLAQQLNRLGNTPFFLNNLECNLADNVMMPVSAINSVRRQVTDEIANLRIMLRQPQKACDSDLEIRMSLLLDEEYAHLMNGDLTKETAPFPALAVAVNGLSEVKAAVDNGANLIYFSGDQFNSPKQPTQSTQSIINQAREYCRSKGVSFWLTTPKIIHDREISDYLPYLNYMLESQPDGILVSAYGWLQILPEITQLPLSADYSFNVFNCQSALFWGLQGINRVTLSTELTGEQISFLARRSPIATELIVHGALPLMISRYCAPGSLLGGKATDIPCSRPCRKNDYFLRDRKNIIFPIKTDNRCLMHIYNSRELCLLDTLPSLTKDGLEILRIEARHEQPAHIARIVQAYRLVLDTLKNHPDQTPNLSDIMDSLRGTGPGFTRGHYYRGVLD